MTAITRAVLARVSADLRVTRADLPTWSEALTFAGVVLVLLFACSLVDVRL